MPAKNTYPIGYIELPNGSKPIFPMNDIFLNYTYDNPLHWETLRLKANIIIEAYRLCKPSTHLKPITGKIKVQTQFQYFLDKSNTTRQQDLKIVEDDTDETYLELQNRAKPDTPLDIRSVEYYGLGIGHSKGKLANQIWLLAEDVDTLLHGKTFTRYILLDEVTGKPHPSTSGILYVSLTQLAKENTLAGELALFLLGKIKDPAHEAVKQIAQTYQISFQSFQNEKEVPSMLTLEQRGIEQGRAEGIVLGEVRLAQEAQKLLEEGVDPIEILRRITEKAI